MLLLREERQICCTSMTSTSNLLIVTTFFTQKQLSPFSFYTESLRIPGLWSITAHYSNGCNKYELTMGCETNGVHGLCETHIAVSFLQVVGLGLECFSGIWKAYKGEFRRLNIPWWRDCHPCPKKRQDGNILSWWDTKVPLFVVWGHDCFTFNTICLQHTSPPSTRSWRPTVWHIHH
jgi:hypothetical protein